MDHTKKCKQCQQHKELNQFSLACVYKGKPILRARCKECCAENGKKLRSAYAQTPKITIQQKYCPMCNKMLLIERFTKSKYTKNGYRSWCFQCEKTETAKRYQNKKELPKIYVTNKRCCTCRKNKLREDFNKSNVEPDGLCVLCKECVKKRNRRHQNASSLRKKLRRHTDIKYKLIDKTRTRINKVIKLQSKSASTIKLLGCTGEECIDYLETLFWPGMTRQNMGKGGWVADHIIPLTSFDKTDPDWQFKAFSYKNLQPLWEEDNLSKQGRLDWSPSESKHELPERLKRPILLQEPDTDHKSD